MGKNRQNGLATYLQKGRSTSYIRDKTHPGKTGNPSFQYTNPYHKVDDWVAQPSEKYACQIRSFPQCFGVKIPKNIPPEMYENPVNDGINYQPQLVSRISEPSTVP